MNIILTNDDGILAKGINSLYDILSIEHNVFMIAPNEEKSGCSNAFTFRQHLQIEHIADNKLAVHGFPVDCVNIGLNADIIQKKIDLVISGINKGPNIGDDIYFSGTVAGARSAYIFGVSGIAISLDCVDNSDYYNDASNFLLEFINDIMKFPQSDPFCLNINYPNISKNMIGGLKYTIMGKRKYFESYKVIHKSNNKMKLKVEGVISSEGKAGSDVEELKNGFISITPLTLDCTDYEYLKKIKIHNK